MALNEPEFGVPYIVKEDGFCRAVTLRGVCEKLMIVQSLEPSEVGVIIVDEYQYRNPAGAAGIDAPKPGAIHVNNCHKQQHSLAIWATGMGFNLAYGKMAPERRRSLDESDPQLFPANRVVYTKTRGDTNAFVNDCLREDFKDVKLLVVVGFHVNACCASTARGGAMMGMTILTSKDMVRTDNGAEDPRFSGFRPSENRAANHEGAAHPHGCWGENAADGWPEGTIIAETY